MKLEKGNNPFYCLISNEHVIKEQMIKSKEYISIFYDFEKINIQIKLNKEERYILSFTFLNIDVTLVEILPKDNIYDFYFCLPNKNHINNF